jgi:hypothetical protein
MGFGYLSYSLSNDKAVAVHALIELQETIAGYEKSLNLKYLSCELSDKSVVELEAEKKQIDEVISPVNDQLKELATVKKSSPSLKVVNTKQEIIKDEVTFLPDDGLLSPNVTRLLQNGWCAVYPSTSECVSPGQSPSKSM